MNDLISRSALIQELQSAKYLCYDNNSISRIGNHEIDRCISFVEDAPTVDLDERDNDAFETGYIKGLCENRPTGEWIPVKTRPMTTEERIKFAEHYGIEYCDTADEKVLDCPLPEDGQEVLVSSRWGVHTDVADNDIDGEGFISYVLEENGDWEGINAWMPLPEPYKKGDNT